MLFGIEIPMYDEFRWVFVVLYFGGMVAMTATMVHAQHVMHQHNRKLPSPIAQELHFTMADGLVRWWGLALQIMMVIIIFMVWRLGTLSGEAWAVLWVIGTLLPVITNIERELGEKGLQLNGVPFMHAK
ncbi:MAG: hypothetical protein WAO28_04305 [Candidatus Microsaccharimonas sp.]